MNGRMRKWNGLLNALSRILNTVLFYFRMWCSRIHHQHTKFMLEKSFIFSCSILQTIRRPNIEFGLCFVLFSFLFPARLSKWFTSLTVICIPQCKTHSATVKVNRCLLLMEKLKAGIDAICTFYQRNCPNIQCKRFVPVISKFITYDKIGLHYTIRLFRWQRSIGRN